MNLDWNGKWNVREYQFFRHLSDTPISEQNDGIFIGFWYDGTCTAQKKVKKRENQKCICRPHLSWKNKIWLSVFFRENNVSIFLRVFFTKIGRCKICRCSRPFCFCFAPKISIWKKNHLFIRQFFYIKSANCTISKTVRAFATLSMSELL